MGSFGHFLYLSSAISFGLVLYTFFMVIIYRLFVKESSSSDIEISSVQEATIDEKTSDMEEIPIEL